MSRHMVRMFGVLGVIGLVGCGEAVGPTLSDDLEGSWVWLSSDGGFAGITRTPASTGDTMTLRFGSDGRAQLERNGAAGPWTPVSIASDADGTSFTVSYDEPLFGFPTQTGHFPEDGVLVLTDACCDGFTHRFERAP